MLVLLGIYNAQKNPVPYNLGIFEYFSVNCVLQIIVCDGGQHLLKLRTCRKNRIYNFFLVLLQGTYEL